MQEKVVAVIGFLIAVVVGIALFMALIVGIAQLARWKCSVYGDQTGYAVEYRLPGGCFAQTPEGWLPIDQIYYRPGP